MHEPQGKVVARWPQCVHHLKLWLAEALAALQPPYQHTARAGCEPARSACSGLGFMQQPCPSDALSVQQGLSPPIAAPAQATKCPWQPAAGSPAPVTLPGPDRSYVIPPYSAGTSETTAGNIIQTADVVFTLTGPDAVPFQTNRQTLFADQLRLLLGNYNFMSVALSDYQVCIYCNVRLGCGTFSWAGGKRLERQLSVVALPRFMK